MALYAMADLHLSLSTNKPMDVFGERWANYHQRIKDNWCLEDNDTIVIPGDISWAMNFEELKADFEFLGNLKGKKIISKGNHDYWWNSLKKLNEFASNYGDIQFLHNNAFEYKEYSICGTRGWIQEPGESSDLKVLVREAGRLKLSLNKAIGEPIVFLHYPPIYAGIYCKEIMDVLLEYNIKRCLYGHLHGPAISAAKVGNFYNIDFSLISSDYLNFTPLLIEP